MWFAVGFGGVGLLYGQKGLLIECDGLLNLVYTVSSSLAVLLMLFLLAFLVLT